MAPEFTAGASARPQAPVAPRRLDPAALAASDRRAGQQATLRQRMALEGVGLHTGAHARLVLNPAPPGTGIVFRRTDLPGAPRVPARFDRVSETRLGTVVTGEGGASVATVEHLLAALAGAGIDNCLAEIDGPEVPIMDGSSGAYAFALECAGRAWLPQPRRFLVVLKEVRVEAGPESWAALVPAAGFSIAFAIDFASRAIGRQAIEADIAGGTFPGAIARARTFGFLHEIEALNRMGLARGGSLDNAIVIDGDTILNAGRLRYADEFVRHKVLDAVGDLALAGGPIIGRYEASRAGHALNNALLRALFADPAAFRWVPDAPLPA